MNYEIRFTAKAERQLEELPKAIAKRIARWIDLIADDPFRVPSRQLEGFPELRRVHASKDYVIIYSVLDDEVVVLVIRISHRRDVYRNL